MSNPVQANPATNPGTLAGNNPQQTPLPPLLDDKVNIIKLHEQIIQCKPIITRKIFIRD